MAKTIHATLWAGYFKEGDDLAHHLKDNDPVAALYAWANQLEVGVMAIRNVAAILEGKEVEIDACTHHIGITGLDVETFERLKKTGIVSEEELDDGDEDEA